MAEDNTPKQNSIMVPLDDLDTVSEKDSNTVDE